MDPAVESNWSNVGEDSPIFSVKASLADNESWYRVALSIPSADGYLFPEKLKAQLRVSQPSDVRIEVQPRVASGSQPLAIGSGTVRLEAVAEDTSGGASLSYQWRKDGIAIADSRLISAGKASGIVSRSEGKFRISFSLPLVDNNTDGIYDLVVENGANFASSEALQCSVDPKILSLDVPPLVNLGDDAKLEVKVAGSGTYSYEWRKNGTKVENAANSVSGANTSVLLLSTVQEDKSGNYSVVVTNGTKVENASIALPLLVAGTVS
jgi:hypothetical protein